jgi:hypothetical protein
MSLKGRKKTVAIMQPTYLPWLGYFGLMQSVDLFILLDSVQFSRRSWQQRNQIKTASGPIWLTVPVLSKGNRDKLITEIEIDHSRDFLQSHQKALELNYKKAPHFSTYMPQLLSVLSADNSNLSDLTIDLIICLRDVLGIQTPILRSSEFEADGTNAELLASICEEVGATQYISPPGSKDYLEKSDAFTKRGIPLHYFNFSHPEYPQQFGDFVHYMSVIDLLFNCGPASLQFIEKGYEVLE